MPAGVDCAGCRVSIFGGGVEAGDGMESISQLFAKLILPSLLDAVIGGCGALSSLAATDPFPVAVVVPRRRRALPFEPLPGWLSALGLCTSKSITIHSLVVQRLVQRFLCTWMHVVNVALNWQETCPWRRTSTHLTVADGQPTRMPEPSGLLIIPDLAFTRNHSC